MIARRAADVLMRHTPRFYGVANRLRRQVLIEARVIRQLGVSGLLSVFSKRRPDALRELPLQPVRRIDLDFPAAPATDDFLDVARALWGECATGGHALYLSPEQFATGPLANVAKGHPPGVGLKVVRNEGAVDSGRYLRGDNHSKLQERMLESATGLLLVANALHVQGVGMRMFDTLDLRIGDRSWLAYVVDHADRKATEAEGTACVERLRSLVRHGDLQLVIPMGFEHPDFLAPDFGNNVRIDRNGAPRYVDFQNFVVPDYGRFLRQLAKVAADASHFGDRSLIRGGRYLYQEVPGTGMPAKRNVRARMSTIDQLLGASGVALAGRVVLDFGCNIGMMMAEYLRRNAQWCVGWDRPAIVSETEKLLLALGCTRFSTLGATLSPQAIVRDTIPAFLQPMLSDAVVSYLAVRGHFGWIRDLAAFPWKYMLYEGHEGESRAQFETHLAELKSMLLCKVLETSEYADGDSRARFVAIIERTGRE